MGLLAGCQFPTAVQADSPHLPSYSPAEAALFDDTFSVDIFGSAAVEPPEPPEKLQERVVLADTVVPARVTTVTRDATDTIRGYTIVMSPTGTALAGDPTAGPIQVVITPQSPSFVRVRGAETTLVGKPLILIFRTYEVDGTETLHWRAESDTEAVRTAIRQATAIRAGRAAEH